MECAQDIYNESLEDVLAAVRETGVQVVLINSPGGEKQFIANSHFLFWVR